jgi:hypothetical protein
MLAAPCASAHQPLRFWPAEFAETMEITLVGEQVFIQVKLNGQKTSYRFLLDNTQPVSITEMVKSQLFTQTGDMASGHEPTARVEQLQLGHVTIEGVNARVLPTIPGAMFCMQIDGILGQEILEALTWQLNISEKYLAIASQLSMLPGYEQQKQLFQAKGNGYPIREIPLKGVGWKTTTTAALNLGQPCFIRLDPAIAGKVPVTDRQVAQRYGGQPLQWIKIPQLTASNSTLGDVWVETTTQQSSNIGVAFARNFSLTFCHLQRKLYLTKTGEDFPERVVGFGFTFAFSPTGEVTIESVVEGSPASHAGLTPGQVLTHVNQFVLTGMQPEKKCATWYDLQDELTTDEIVELHVAALDKNGNPVNLVLRRTDF